MSALTQFCKRIWPIWKDFLIHSQYMHLCFFKNTYRSEYIYNHHIQNFTNLETPENCQRIPLDPSRWELLSSWPQGDDRACSSFGFSVPHQTTKTMERWTLVILWRSTSINYLWYPMMICRIRQKTLKLACRVWLGYTSSSSASWQRCQ